MLSTNDERRVPRLFFSTSAHASEQQKQQRTTNAANNNNNNQKKKKKKNDDDDDDDDDDDLLIVKEDVEKGRKEWEKVPKIMRAAIIKLALINDRRQCVWNEIVEGRLGAIERERMGTLEKRFEILLSAVESEREHSEHVQRRLTEVEREHERFREEAENVIGGLERKVLEFHDAFVNARAQGEQMKKLERIVKAQEIALAECANSVDDCLACAEVAKDEARQCVKQLERGFDVDDLRNDVNVLSAQMSRVEQETKEAKQAAQIAKKAAKNADTSAQNCDIERTKAQNYAEVCAEFSQNVDRKMQALKAGLQACDDADVLLCERVRQAKVEVENTTKTLDNFANNARSKLADSCQHVERVARTCANVADASTREISETVENEKETLRIIAEEMELRFRDECERLEKTGKVARDNITNVAEITKQQVVEDCGQVCDVVIAKFVQEHASELSETVTFAIKEKASEAAADARRCAEMAADVSKIAKNAEMMFQRKIDDGFRSADVAIARAEAAQVDISTQKETILRAVDEALDALRQREVSCSKRMHDENEERMRAFRRTIDEMKKSIGNIDAADVVAFKKRCDGLENRVGECEKNGRVSFGTIEHLNRELERLVLDFNDVRVDVSERVRRDEEVCRELERIEKRLKEEIQSALDRAQSFTQMEVEPLRLENVEKIEGICEALFGFANGKSAGRDAQTIRAMTKTMFLENSSAARYSSELGYLSSSVDSSAALQASTDYSFNTNEGEESVFAKLRRLEALAKTFERKSDVERLANDIASRQTENATVLKSLHDGVQIAMRERPTRAAVEHLVKDISERVLELEADKEVNKTRLRQVSETAKEIIDRRCEALETTHRQQLRKLANTRLTQSEEVSSFSTFTNTTTNNSNETRIETILLDQYPKRIEIDAAIAAVENQIRRVEARTQSKLDLKADKSEIIALAERRVN